MDDNDDLISELQDLRRDLGATYQRTCGAMNRAELLNGLGWDYGEERVRLEHLKRDFPWLRASITDAASAAAFLQQQPSAIKRPVVQWPSGTITIGFNAEDWQQLLTHAG